MVAIVHSIYSQSVREPACGAGSWTTTLGGTVYSCHTITNMDLVLKYLNIFWYFKYCNINLATDLDLQDP